jgi:hypothetical protein
VTDELDECSWDEGTVTMENWFQISCIRADRSLFSMRQLVFKSTAG